MTNLRVKALLALFLVTIPTAGFTLSSPTPILQSEALGRHHSIITPVQDIPNHVETRAYLDRTYTQYFDPVPASKSDFQAFRIRIEKLIDRGTCKGLPAEKLNVQYQEGAFAEATILERRNTNYSKSTINICLEALPVKPFRVGDEGIVVAITTYDDLFVVPAQQTLNDEIQNIRDAGGMCFGTFCLGGRTGLSVKP